MYIYIYTRVCVSRNMAQVSWRVSAAMSVNKFQMNDDDDIDLK
jgi:hypothetical protein